MLSSLSMIDLKSPTAGPLRPKYLRVCDHLYAEIHAGRLIPGQSLPPEAKLSAILGVSRNTLRQALGKLEEDGLIERVQGRGTILTTDQQRESRKLHSSFAFVAPQIREGVYPSLIHGFEQACSSVQHQAVIGNSGNDVGRQADLLMQLMDQSIGGVAVVPPTQPTPAYQIGLLQKNYIPVVCCHRTVEGVSAPSVVFSGYEAGWKAAQALLDRGHRRIALFYPHRYSMIDERESGMRAAISGHIDSSNCELQLAEYGTKQTQPDESARDAIGTRLAHIISQPNRPTAIFCGSLTEAEQIYLQVGAFGVEIPRDLSLIYFGSTWRGSTLAERISCICVDEHEIGARAARLLHEMRTGKRPIDNNEQIVFSASLCEAETLGPCPQTLKTGN